LAILCFYGELEDEAIIDMLDFFLEIISTDGEYIDALDEQAPVAAALEAYGFLATLIDIADTETAFDVFVDQLESSSTMVLIAAGENIALLYEKAYRPVEDDEEYDFVVEDEWGKNKKYFKKLYSLPDRQLENKLKRLQSHSGKSVSKADRKSLHASFADILHTVENPTHGPRFSTSLDPTGQERGSRIKLKSKSAIATIDKWWMLHRHRALKEVLNHGFMVHYETNEAIFEALPIVFVSDAVRKANGKKKSRNGQFGNTEFVVEEWD
jgi:hypothetical protein